MIRLFRYSEVTIMHMTSVHEQKNYNRQKKNTGNISGKFEQLAIEDLHVYEILQ